MEDLSAQPRGVKLKAADTPSASSAEVTHSSDFFGVDRASAIELGVRTLKKLQHDAWAEIILKGMHNKVDEVTLSQQEASIDALLELVAATDKAHAKAETWALIKEKVIDNPAVKTRGLVEDKDAYARFEGLWQQAFADKVDRVDLDTMRDAVVGGKH